MKRNKPIKMEVDACIEVEVKVTCNYIPERPAPFTMNHDSPNFSDPGDDEEFDDLKITIGGIDITEYIDEKELEWVKDEIRTQVPINCDC